MKKMPKMLLLSRSVPPGVSGSSIIVSNLAKQFTRDEMVVLGAYKRNMPAVDWRPEYPKLGYATLQIGDGVRGERWVRWFQLPLLLVSVLWTLYTQRCRILLTVYPDMVYLFAGYLASVISNKPLFVYFHNTLVQARPASSFARWLQAAVFKRARFVFVMSEGMRRLYTELYPDLKCEPLVHSFNEQIPTFESVAPRLRQTNDRLHIVFSGNLNSSNRGAVEVIAKMLPYLPDADVTIYTGTHHQTFKNLGFEGDRIEITSVSRDILISKLAEADVLLLPHGFTDSFAEEETRTIFPTKIIEYLLAGRPIVAVLPQETFLADFLKHYDCAVVVTKPDPVALTEAIRRVQTDKALAEHLVRNALNAVQQFYAPTVANELREGILHHLNVGLKSKQVQSDTSV